CPDRPGERDTHPGQWPCPADGVREAYDRPVWLRLAGEVRPMLTSKLRGLLGIRHPVLGGMGLGTSPELVAAVSNAGGLGIQGCAGRDPAEIAVLDNEIRARTDRPFGMNLMLFAAGPAEVEAVLAARPAVLSTAWARPDQDLARLFAHADDAEVIV